MTRFCSCSNRAVASEHDKHFRFVRRGLFERLLDLICLRTPRFTVVHARAFEDLEYLCLRFGIAAAA